MTKFFPHCRMLPKAVNELNLEKISASFFSFVLLVVRELCFCVGHSLGLVLCPREPMEPFLTVFSGPVRKSSECILCF